ncbi:hypothetical protein ACVWZA_002611 [Sphingomonas sp. UYAg733]
MAGGGRRAAGGGSGNVRLAAARTEAIANAQYRKVIRAPINRRPRAQGIRMKDSHDLMGLIKFSGRSPWDGYLAIVMADHFEPAMDEFGIDADQLGDMVGPGYQGTLWGCAFEDMLTQSFGPNDENIVDDYIKRRGWNEKGPNKTYMKALRHSVMSLYEVSEIIPGQSLLARDLLRESEPILVIEHSATRTLGQWDRIGARIVSSGGRNVLAGGLLPFSHQAAKELIDAFAEILANDNGSGSDTIDPDDLLSLHAPLFTDIWLHDLLSMATGTNRPDLQNSDGDDIMFHAIRYPLEGGVTQKAVAERVGLLKEFSRENAKFWNWIGAPPAKTGKSAKGDNVMTWNTMMDDGALVLGNLELEGRFVILSVNSARRAKKGQALLDKLLAGLVRSPLVEIQTIDQIVAANADAAPAPDPDIPPAEVERIIHDMIDRQYRATLDEPVGMLGDVTPRAATKTAAGRKKLVEWLKYLENGTSRRGSAEDPMATYNFDWMWRELGIEELRR